MKAKIESKMAKLEALKLALETVETMQDGCKVWDTETEQFILPYDTESSYHRDQMRKIDGLTWLYDELVKLADKV